MPRFARLQTVALFTLLCLCLVSASAVVIFALMKGLK
jgi:hypothetical protein